MKLTSLLTLFSAVLCLLGEYALNFSVGFYEQSLHPTFWAMILFLIEYFVLLPLLLIIWVICLIKKHHRLWTTTMLAGLLALWCIARVLPPPPAFIMYGMRDRVMRDYSLDDLRHLARDFDRLPPISSSISGSTKGYMRGDLANTGLSKKYSFLDWPKNREVQGPSYIAETDGIVDVRWGGALVGHWGFSVAVNGRRINGQPDSKISRASEDILFVFDYN